MPKGIFTQTLCVLLESSVSLQQLEHVLAAYQVRGKHVETESWPFGGPSLTLSFRPEVNGYVAVDIVDRRWPDHMGDPKQETMLFGAWSMGHFGPFAFPGGLERASQQCWAWEAGKTIARRHRSFIRIRSSYVFGAKEQVLMKPHDYDAVSELQFVTEVAQAVLGLPTALCYFNPNGEVLRDRAGLQESLAYARSSKLLPLDLWSNIRLFNLGADWFLMDTVGNGQFGRRSRVDLALSQLGL